MLGVSEGIPHPVHLLLPLSVRSLLRQLLGDGRSLTCGGHWTPDVGNDNVQAMHGFTSGALYSVMLTEPSGFAVFPSTSSRAESRDG